MACSAQAEAVCEGRTEAAAGRIEADPYPGLSRNSVGLCRFSRIFSDFLRFSKIFLRFF